MTLPFQRRIVILIVVVILTAIVLRRAYIFAANRATKGAESSAYKAVAGPFDTDTAADIVLHDAQRNKDLHVKVTYPKADGKFPVIVFSHGFGGSKDTYASLTTYWAARGYVVIQPTHDDSIAQRKANGEIHGVMQGFSTLREDISDPAAWRNRTRDVSFVIDSLDEIERRVPGTAGKLDRSHIGAGGHSFGALTTELLGGLTCHSARRVKARKPGRPPHLRSAGPQRRWPQATWRHRIVLGRYHRAAHADDRHARYGRRRTESRHAH